MNIREKLIELSEKDYGDFQVKLIPDHNREYFLGVRSPKARKLAKELYMGGEYKEFLNELPHTYFDEYQLHCFIIDEMKDYDECIEALEALVPYMSNWAETDAINPKIFKKHTNELFPHVLKWIHSENPFEIREGVKLLMTYYLHEDFRKEHLSLVADIKSEHYYVNMMRAWYYATALVFQYEATIKVLESNILDIWTHNKTIQKSIESFRISEDSKNYLRTLKR